MSGHIKQHYLHCPKCGVLDRVFEVERITVEGIDIPTYCGKCKAYSPLSRWIQPQEGREWIAVRLGREISVVRRSHLHGRISCGWFNEDKILIASVGDYNGKVSPVSDAILELAKNEADRMNREETGSNKTETA